MYGEDFYEDFGESLDDEKEFEEQYNKIKKSSTPAPSQSQRGVKQQN